jgi:hypothetical protein
MEYDTQDVVNYAINGDIADLEKAFDSVMKDKINNAFETRKQEIGQSIGAIEEE